MDIAMCRDFDCPNQDSCWRLNAPPNLHHQSYCDFKFDYYAYEAGNYECKFYIDMTKLEFKDK
ncbi:MAG: hypothetical protein COA43_14625 [Robiginitomaculum sp.]|nr:MAG: hypothetical protein COA43_14625 [Robiginitomaculum sp.]